MNYLNKSINNSIQLKKKLRKLHNQVNNFVNKIYSTILKNNKIFICGNGGSAADAQHLSAEFLVRLNPKINRRPLPIIPLALDTSTLTACGNDYNFDYIFSRTLDGLGAADDLLFCISTSGNSKNIINVIKLAIKKKIDVICFLGMGGGKVKRLFKKKINYLVIPSRDVARIQECHIFLGHIIFNLVEKKIIKK